jgi:hypothetical protein
MQYIQYDEAGNITASVMSNGTAPACERQLVLVEITDITAKRVDVRTLAVIDVESAPALEPEVE